MKLSRRSFMKANAIAAAAAAAGASIGGAVQARGHAPDARERGGGAYQSACCVHGARGWTGAELFGR